jgi:SAM-dependent methyltransferase
MTRSSRSIFPPVDGSRKCAHPPDRFVRHFENLVQIRHDTDQIADAPKDCVLYWLDSEQGAPSEVARKYIPELLQTCPERLILDPGCGSGVLSLITVKSFEGRIRERSMRVVGIDVNPRAIEFARTNAFDNNVDDLYTFIEGPYEVENVPPGSAALISHNVPYHPHHPKYSKGLPIFACGGEDGQELLRNHLEVSSHHLGRNGILYGVIMCRGNEEPEFFSYIRDYFPSESIFWHQIYEPIDSHYFLSYINRNKEPAWVDSVVKRFTHMHLGVYVVRRDGAGGEITFYSDKLEYARPGWEERLDAHRDIQDRAVRDLEATPL